jgi:uncharacterized membrane protein YdbT with pleckstrin-like domain
MTSPFSIFFTSTNSFDGQEAGEKVILVLRRHPFVILIKLFGYILLALLPLIAHDLFLTVLPSFPVSPYLLRFLYSLWCLFIWSSFFYAITMYMLDVWIVTDRRIIDSTQHGFFNRTVSELHLTRVQDISVHTVGVIPTLLHFGDLQVQTAGTEEKFNFLQIPNPLAVKDAIMAVVTDHLPHQTVNP